MFSSFGGLLFLVAFTKHYLVGAIVTYGELIALNIIEVNFLVRALLFFAICAFFFRSDTMNAFGVSTKKRTAAVVALITNLILAAVLYDF